MSGLKHILPKAIFTDGNLLGLRKRSQEYKSIFINLIDYLQNVNTIYTNYYTYFQQNLEALVVDEQKGGFNQKIYKQIANIFKNFNKELRIFIEKQSIHEKPIIQIPHIFMTDYNHLLTIFQQKAKQYTINEFNLTQMCNKYYKLYKQMQTCTQQYKKSFVDVKLIYNKDEKIKLYNECSNIYYNLLEENSLIEQKVEQINKDRAALSQCYKTLEKQMINFSLSFASRYIDQIKKYVLDLIEHQTYKLNHLIDHLLYIQKIPPTSFFIMTFNVKYQEYLNKDIAIQQCKIIPSFLLYSQCLNPEGRIFFKKIILNYFQEITNKIEKRKNINKRFVDYLNKYSKTYEKYIIQPHKQLHNNTQKLKKRISEILGHKWVYFFKSIKLLFDNNIENQLKFESKTKNIIKNIENLVQKQQTTLDNFGKQFKNYIQKYISKKIVRKYLNYDGKSQKIDDEPLNQQKQTTAQQILQLSKILIDQIFKLDQINNKLEQLLKQNYISYMNEIKNAIGQYTSFCNEYKNNSYKEQSYFTHTKECQEDVMEFVKKEMRFFEQSPLGFFNKNFNKIVFDGEINRLQGFKKLKKPKELQEQLKDGFKQLSSINFENSIQISKQLIATEKSIDIQQQKLRKQQQKMKKQEQKKIFLGQMNSKNAQFISSKINFYPNQKYIKSYSCALSDTVYLTGRLYITTYRLLFYSKFNRNNVFFGETFIQIPKKDIKKMQKRYSSFFFDNSISITTVNGQLIFVSLMSRNQTYDYIKSTFQINSEEIYFQEQKDDEQQQCPQLNTQFQDDMKQQASILRQISIQRILKTFQYQLAYQGQFQCSNINVVKFLKLFQLDQEITINRITYPSFLYYIKDKQQHKSISIEPWNPNPLDFCNINNIKQGSPEIYTKKVVADVPLPPSNIPFLPKSALTSQEHTLYIINKNKYVIQIVVRTSGIPYCDAYQLRLRKTITYQQQNKVKMTVELYINFHQKVMVKSTIQSKAFDGTKQNYGRIGQQIKGHLKILQKKLQKGNKKETPEDKLRQLTQQISQMQKVADSQKQTKRQLQKQLQIKRSQLKMKNIIIICLSILICIQFLIILN